MTPKKKTPKKPEPVKPAAQLEGDDGSGVHTDPNTDMHSGDTK